MFNVLEIHSLKDCIYVRFRQYYNMFALVKWPVIPKIYISPMFNVLEIHSLKDCIYVRFRQYYMFALVKWPVFPKKYKLRKGHFSNIYGIYSECFSLLSSRLNPHFSQKQKLLKTNWQNTMRVIFTFFSMITTTTLVLLETPTVLAQTCSLHEHAACLGNENACCAGLECKGNNNWKSCKVDTKATCLKEWTECTNDPTGKYITGVQSHVTLLILLTMCSFFSSILHL
jgi:hypothetical protein